MIIIITTFFLLQPPPSPPPDGHFTSLPQRGARHPAGRALPGELLLAGGGATQQARGGSSVSVTAGLTRSATAHELGFPVISFYW